jgi:hypothetical protein
VVRQKNAVIKKEKHERELDEVINKNIVCSVDETNNINDIDM